MWFFLNFEILSHFQYWVIWREITRFVFWEGNCIILNLGKIDQDDWRKNTRYRNFAEPCELITWWWEIVSELVDLERARLLQFVTGSSRLPLAGFAALRGNFLLLEGFSQSRLYCLNDDLELNITFNTGAIWKKLVKYSVIFIQHVQITFLSIQICHFWIFF